MASSGIGGQAVMEGVMMKNQDTYAIAVRKPDQTIIVEKKEYKSIGPKVLQKIPIVRGVISFIDSLVLGMGSLTFSASFFEEEETEKAEAQAEPANENGKAQAKGDPAKKESLIMGLTMVLAVVLALAIFMALPYGISLLFQRFIPWDTVVILLEGVFRLGIFILYIVLISRMEDIQRVFMYHGAEHKCINCIEHGLDLNVENVRASSKVHKRCGTSFLFFVVVVSIIATMFIRVDSRVLRLALRLLIIPLVAGLSYEFIRLAGRSENPIVNALSKPGLWLQALTTREPDDCMIEVGIASVEAVFDWEGYVAGLRGSQEGPIEKS
ncbi:MAG: DUF1385 domain-containing protein [Lachnospiraceae bacterium]|nr:DUF1385 domain-containing protein [Lachnospiraceae bacterium]